MKPLFLKGLAGTVVAGTVATGGVFTWKHVTKPTDVRGRLVWEGYTVADVSKDGVWRAIYLAKHNESGFSTFVSGSNKTEVGPKLKQKCSDLLSVSASDERYESSYEDAKKWCLNPELATIEMQFDFEDREFASGDDDFKNLFTLNKGIEAFVNAVKASVSSFSNSTPLTTAHGNVKTWCDAMKTKKPFGDDLKNAKDWCTKPVSTLNDFMDKEGFKPVPLDGWSSKFSALSSDISLSTDVSSGSGTDGDKLKSWCDGKNLGTNQIHSLSEGDNFEKVKRRCFVSK